MYEVQLLMPIVYPTPLCPFSRIINSIITIQEKSYESLIFFQKNSYLGRCRKMCSEVFLKSDFPEKPAIKCKR
jgi:hypothetical protein